MANIAETITKFLDKIGRRTVFLVVAVVIAVPILFPFGLPVKVSKTTRMFYDSVEAAAHGKQAVLLSVDYDPNVMPECHPMTIAFLRHCFKRHVRVLIVCLYAQQIGLAQDAIQTVTREFEGRGEAPVYGTDYVFLGWKPPPIIPLLGMGESIRGVFPTDHYGNNTADLPLLEEVDRYADLDLVADFSGSQTTEWYIAYAEARFGIHVICGVTGISVADYYPYIQSRQLLGMLEGMKGAAEYEKLVKEVVGVPGRQMANEGMSSQSSAHLAIMVFVVLGNLGYFLSRKKKPVVKEAKKQEDG